jgi:hypothetical protein
VAPASRLRRHFLGRLRLLHLYPLRQLLRRLRWADCSRHGCFSGELQGANQTDANNGGHCVNGWPGSSDGTSFSTGGSAPGSPFSPSYVSQVLNIFDYDCAPVTFTKPNGAPAVTVEAPAANSSGGFPSSLGFLAADVPADASGLSFGPYTDSATPSCGLGAFWFAYQMAVELP